MYCDEEDNDSYRCIDPTRPIKLTMDQPKIEEPTGLDKKEVYTQFIREQVCYYDMLKEERYRYEKDFIDGIIGVIVDTIITEPPDGVEWINKRPYPHAVVVSRYMKTDYTILTHVISQLKGTTHEIRSLRGYMKTVIYNAMDEIPVSIQAQVNYDMRGGGWIEKGII